MCAWPEKGGDLLNKKIIVVCFMILRGPDAQITLSGGAAVSLAVRRVPAKLRSIELQRQSNYNSGSEASLLSAVMDQVCLLTEDPCRTPPCLA